MRNSLRLLGSLSIVLAVGTGYAHSGELSNVTVGRFEDFTVVTLFGEGAMTVTHQIVDAKDDKPHRIVVDVTGAVHRLPQNNYSELPEGSITAIRTSQFAVSPEPVVRVVLDLAHPATYRLESPEGQVRLLISLPGDPAIASTWSAREGALPATGANVSPILAEAATVQAAPGADAASEVTSDQGTTWAENDPAPAADATADPSAPAATSAPTTETSHTESGAPAGNTDESGNATQEESAPAEATPATPVSEPAASPAPEGEIRALPPAAAGALAANEATSPEAASQENASNSASPEAEATATATETSHATADPAGSNSTEPEAWTAGAAAPESNSAEPSVSEQAGEQATTSANAWENEEQAPQVPLPEASKNQPERTIDYNLPVPASMAALNQGPAVGSSTDAQPHAEAATESETEAVLDPAAPKLAVKPAPEGDLATTSTEAPAVSSTDAAATDMGSAPVASLTTLPPIVESAQELVPERQQIIYHTQGRRDPFKALLTAGGYSAASLPDVATLRLVGVLSDVQESWGLFEDANGYGYILRKGDRVRNGSLTQLTNNRAYFSLTEFGWSRSVHIDLEPEG